MGLNARELLHNIHRLKERLIEASLILLGNDQDAIVVTLEALRTADRGPVRRARELLGAFLDAHQILGDVLPEASAPERTHGAFPLTPVHGFLRADVTAHAVLARRGRY